MLFTAISASCENTQTGTSLQFAFSDNSAESQNIQKSIFTKKETDSSNLTAQDRFKAYLDYFKIKYD